MSESATKGSAADEKCFIGSLLVSHKSSPDLSEILSVSDMICGLIYCLVICYIHFVEDRSIENWYVLTQKATEET